VQGVDYSFDPPNLDRLRASGIDFVIRYIGPSFSAKHVTRGEADAILARGMALGLCYQTTERFMLGGFGAGVAAGEVAAARTAALGQPGDRPIYFALDSDPRGLGGGSIEAVRQFLAGAAVVLGRHRVGIYGGFRAIEIFCPDDAPFGWQTYAWSDGLWSAKAQVRQVANNVAFAGGLVDFDVSIADDFGQWPAPTPAPQKDWFDMATRDELKQVLREVVAETLAGGRFPPRFLGFESGTSGVIWACNGVTMERMNLTADDFAIQQYEAMGYVRPPGGGFYSIGRETLQFYDEVPKAPH
jgi:hypothetical protein